MCPEKRKTTYKGSAVQKPAGVPTSGQTKPDKGRIFFLSLFIVAVLSFFAFMFFFTKTYFYSASLHLGMFSAAMFFLWKGGIRPTLTGIGVPGDLKKNIIYSIGGFMALVAALSALFAAMVLLGIPNDSGNVQELIRGLPPFVPLLAVLIAPFTEELFFRGLLVPKVGVIPAAVIFGAFHFTYGSNVEIIGAMIVGIIFGYLYKGSGSLVPPIAVHFCYNLISIFVMFLW